MRMLAAALLAAAPLTPAAAQDADLAQQLTNPVASLIQVPLQTNLDWGWGADGRGFRVTTNVQPVVPFALNPEWNLISRTILPLIAQTDVTARGASQSGLGDTVQSLFFSPSAKSASGIVWGAGPVFLAPTATSRALGTGKWGVGPTAVVLKMDGQVTYGALANHIWSFAGVADRSDVSATFVQPFFAFTTAGATTYGVSSETTYDWVSDQWLVPVNFTVTQLLRVGKLPISAGVGGRYMLESPRGAPDWGIRLVVTLLLPS